ncbi:hypothetical protein [Actinoplanes missouriensis]|uniref:hypothetical protein n=1 Tax=Actinoplanes missouriensis TaxID=1866 RepID=UPI0012F79BF3|nr:hypothetical protein [Actinoplanes missouriensis]
MPVRPEPRRKVIGPVVFGPAARRRGGPAAWRPGGVAARRPGGAAARRPGGPQRPSRRNW